MKKTSIKRMLSLLTVLAVFFAFMPASYAEGFESADFDIKEVGGGAIYSI